jgi:hypothetical protein
MAIGGAMITSNLGWTALFGKWLAIYKEVMSDKVKLLIAAGIRLMA